MKTISEQSENPTKKLGRCPKFLCSLNIYFLTALLIATTTFSNNIFAQGADVIGLPAVINAEVGNDYSVILQIDASEQEVAAAEFLLSFNQNLIQVNSIGFADGNLLTSSLPSPLPGGLNIDNTNGKLYYGGFKTPPAANILFDFIEIEFTAIATGSSQINYITSGFPATSVSFAGFDVTGELNPITINNTSVLVDCPDLGVNNGDPCITDQDEEGAYVNCACLPFDCANVAGGSAFIDDCGDCVGGTTGEDPCLNCDPGFFNNGGACQECPPGTYCPGDGNSYPCDAGAFQGLPGQTECLSCGPGSYSDIIGATECQLCPSGTYQGASGSIACLDCEEGTDSGQGAIECEIIDCNGVLGGAAYEDDCSVCDDDPANDNITCLDCAGIVNGDALPGSLCFNGDDSGVYDADCNCISNNTGSLDGHVDWLSECGSRNITIELYNQSDSELNEVYFTTIDASGDFTTPAFSTGTYDILITVEGYLSQLYSDVQIGNGINELDVTGIIPGDIDGSNGVNINDVSLLITGFGSSQSDSNYNFLADFNCDGAINIIDISILTISFGLVGDNPPND